MIPVGHEADGSIVYLDAEDLQTHVHGIGATRTGKSKLIEHIVRHLMTQEAGFCLIDPHGVLYRDVLSWASVVRPYQRIHLFDPSYSKRIVGYNPFRAEYTDPAQITTRVHEMVAATMRMWGGRSPHDAPRLNKWLTCLYYAIIQQQLPMREAMLFLRYASTPRRDEIIQRINADEVREKWEEIVSMSPGQFRQFLEPVESRLMLFAHPHVQRILNAPALDIPAIVDTTSALLVNLQHAEDDIISAEANLVLGAFIINDVWRYLYKQSGAKEFYLIVDECYLLLTPETKYILDQAAKYGLHLFLFHQHESQLQDARISGMLERARIKVKFYDETNRLYQLRRPNKPPVDVRTPDVRPQPTFLREEYIAHLLQDYPTVADADAALALPIPPPAGAVESNTPSPPVESPSTQIFSNAPANEPSDEDFYE